MRYRIWAFVIKDYISTLSKYMDFNPLPCNCPGCSSKIPGLSIALCHKMNEWHFCTRNELLNGKQHEGPESWISRSLSIDIDSSWIRPWNCSYNTCLFKTSKFHYQGFLIPGAPRVQDSNCFGVSAYPDLLSALLFLFCKVNETSDVFQATLLIKKKKKVICCTGWC